ncbi:MAG TPA: EamA family transporter [Bryobacteraceae bacterium]
MPQRRPMTRQQVIVLIVACTLLTAVAQILIKTGAGTLTRSNPWSMLTNVPLVAGYSLYGLMTVMFIYALRDEELSFVYPIISLSYVWVAVLSVWLLHEVLNPWKMAGVATIVAGVAVLGKDTRK